MYVGLGQMMLTAMTPSTTTRTTALPTCASAAEKADATNRCLQSKQAAVRGLGQLAAWKYPVGHKFYGMDPCKVQTMPACVTFLTPTQPPPATTPLPPSSTLARPSAAVATTTLREACPPGHVYVQGICQPVTPAPAPEKKKLGIATVGLIAAVAIGGGYLIYRRTRKGKQAA